MRARAASVLVLVLAVLAGCGGDADTPTLPPDRTFAVSRSITPLVHLFGDPVVARIDVIVDTERYDPEHVRVVPEFEPFELDGQPRRVTRDFGRYAHVRWDFTYRCLVYECLEEVAGGPPQVQPGGLPPPNFAGGFGDRKSFRIAPARVIYDDPQHGVERIGTVSWPPIQNASRLNMGDTNVTGIGFPFEVSVAPLPAANYRVAPLALGVAFVLGALALLAFPAALVVRQLRRRPVPVEEPEPELTPLERALHLVEWSRDRPGGARREALESLAYELDGDASELTGQARRLAWSPRDPAPEAMTELVQSVKETGGASARS
jgi:hypothetical protein